MGTYYLKHKNHDCGILIIDDITGNVLAYKNDDQPEQVNRCIKEFLLGVVQPSFLLSLVLPCTRRVSCLPLKLGLLDK